MKGDLTEFKTVNIFKNNNEEERKVKINEIIRTLCLKDAQRNGQMADFLIENQNNK